LKNFNESEKLEKMFDKYPEIISYILDTELKSIIPDSVKNNPKYKYIFNSKNIDLM